MENEKLENVIQMLNLKDQDITKKINRMRRKLRKSQKDFIKKIM